MSFSDWQKKRKNNEQTPAQTTAPAAPATSFSQWMTSKRETSTVEGWMNSVSAFTDEVNNRYKSWNGSAEDYDSSFSRSQELLQAADTWRKKYSDNAQMVSAINNAVDILGQTQEYAKGYYDFYSQFEDAETYDNWTRKQDFINRYQQDAEKALAGEYDESWLGEAETKRLAGNADFDEKSAYQSTATGKRFGKRYDDELYELINGALEFRDKGSLSEVEGRGTNRVETDYYNRALEHLNEDEIKAYNYLYATEGKDAAEEYLDSLNEMLIARRAGKQYKAIDNDFERYLHLISSGLEQHMYGWRNAGAMAFATDDVITPASQYTSAMVSEDLAGKGLKLPEWMGGGSSAQMFGDILNTSANMAPSILVSLIPGVGSVAGVASMGISASGNAYAEMKRLGYDNVTSQNYAALVGASEAVLQKVLGGISSLGGASEGIFQKIASTVLPKVDRALARVALELGASMADEGLEEALQSVLEPIFKRITTGKSFEGIDWEEVTYSALLGGITGGVFEGTPTIAKTGINSFNAVKEYRPNQAALVEEALAQKPDSKYVQKLSERVAKGKNLSGLQLDRLAEITGGKIAETAAKDTTTEKSPEIQPEASAQEEKAAEATNATPEEEKAVQAEYEAPEATQSAETVDIRAALTEASKHYGKQAEAMIALYREGQDVEDYDRAFGIAYNMGAAGVSLNYAMNDASTAYLTEEQRRLAYNVGAGSTDAKAEEQDASNKAAANGKTGRRKGTVRGQNVTVAELKKTFNDAQGVAYRLLSTYAEATGIDIVLYKSEADADGRFEGAQGRFNRTEDTIYIDVNAGLANVKSVTDLAKYTMLRTFAHEFTHFVEKWNPIQYNEFRRVVFDTMEARGTDVNELIVTKQEQTGLSYEMASREVVAEAMTDVLPDSNFAEQLAENHKTIFDKLIEKLKEFVADLKAYFNTIQRGRSSTTEAKALMEQVGETVKYLDGIVALFDRVAVEAVESYQMAVALDEPAATEPVKAPEPVAEVAEEAVKEEPAPVAEPEPEPAPVAEEKAPEEVTEPAAEEGNGDAFTITDNAEFGTLEIKFDGKPSEAVRNALKANKFRWHNKKGVWYGKAERADIVRDLREAYRADEAPAVEEAAPAVENVVETPVSDTSTTQNRDTMDSEAPVAEETAPAEEVKATIAPATEAELEAKYKAFDKKFAALDKSKWRFASWPLPSNVNFILDGALGIRATEDEIVTGQVKYMKGRNELDSFGTLPEYLVDSLKNANQLITDAPVEIKYNGKSLLAFTVDGANYFFSKKYVSALDGSIFYMGDFSKAKILKAVDESGEIVGMILPVMMPKNFQITESKPVRLKSFSAKKATKTNTTQEVTSNGENADNAGAVQQSVSDRSGDSHVLDEVEAQDVSRDAQRGDSVGDPEERGRETVRDDLRADAERPVGGSSEGSRQSGDLRRDDGLTAEESTPERAEELHEEVVQEIEQKSTENPRGRNFVIGDSLDLPSGEKARYKANVEAIRLVKKLEAENRHATAEEQVILSKYVGWGGLANAFDKRKADWSKEFTELSELLSKEEYESARGSTLNAHYTDISVIKAMYDGLSCLGFNGGRMLEPSAGVGNFVGAMPEAMAAKVKSWTMVELDTITGLIAKHLYPNSDVRIQGFEKANIPDNYMDVVISNVPFGDYAIADKKYPKRITKAIHNYFFAKSLDKVRVGGIVMFITSSFTMNAKDPAVRQYIMNKADLLGAIRLPDTAFKGNAGTEVVTDILILKKRAPNTPYAGVDFLEAPWTQVSAERYTGATINNYFTNHPEMVLGTPTVGSGMYSSNTLTYKAFTDRGSLADQIREAFTHIEGKMDYPATLSRERTNFAVERATKKAKEGGLVVKDGKVYKNQNGELTEMNTAKGVAERVSGMLGIRDAARDLMNFQQQGLGEAEIKKARTKLNKAYDAFVEKYGYINSRANKSAITEDPDSFSILALENWDADKKTATKTDVFSKNTISANRTVTSAKDVREGMIVSVNQTGGVDASLIARLTGKTEADVTRELIEARMAFKNRNGVLEAAETYLSGNVRAKLRDAEALAPIDPDYRNNVDALKQVIPPDVSYRDIFVNPGTPWIPNSVYSDFAAYMLGGHNSEWRQIIDVTRNPETGNFTIELKDRYYKSNSANTQKWGTPRRSFLDLFDSMLNSKSVVVKDKLADGSTVVNRDATAAANEKMENIQKEFQDWLWRDETRRTELSTLYNETFNSVVTPKYNGDNLTVNGSNAIKQLRPHQRNAVQRVISSGGNTLLAHKVGAGKTYEMAASAMKLKELGLVKKPLFTVPKSLVAQWGVEFKDFFPMAKLLVADEADFTAANRKVFMNRIANGDYDAVIVSYEQFEKLPMSDDFTRSMYQEEIDSVIAAIEEAKADKGDKALSIKDLEKKRKSLQTKIDKLTDKAKDEGNISFEELGVDSLFVDEAHNFKNLFYTTSMTNVSGLGNKEGSKRAFDLYTKVRYLQQLNGGRGIVFATATPVMNSMSEMYIMQKYLQPDLLDQLGLSTFDAWAKQFGEVVNGVEIKPSGQGYRVKQSFSRFKNMSELQLLFRNFADVLTDIPGLKIPKMKGGKVNVVVCDPGQFQQDFMKTLEERADNVKNVDPSVDNMLKITSDGRKISYTQRMIDPTLPYEEGCKIYRCADNVIKGYKDSAKIKGTQLIFCDMATPKGKSKVENTTEDVDNEMDLQSAQLYDDLKARLVAGGIPAKEIAFIHDADTDQKKKKLFADVNDGKVRVLIGSTGKMGVGMNAQKRVVAIHHLDAPWRPGDVEQRNGRAFRQGNINDEVECFTYVTEGSFDARLWDILERKQNFINQIMNGENVGRETEDTGEVTLSAAEVKALASGSPLIMEQVQLDTDIKKLESLYRSHTSAVRAAKDKYILDKSDIAMLEANIEDGKADIAARKDTYSEGKFSMTVGKLRFTEKKDAGEALMAQATAKATEQGYTTVGTFAGFELRVVKTPEGIKGLLQGEQGYPFKTYPNSTTTMVNQLISVAEGLDNRVKAWERELAETRADMTEQEKLMAEPFAKQAELDSKRARYNEVMAILNPKEEQSLDSVDEETVQEQSRAYLGDFADEMAVSEDEVGENYETSVGKYSASEIFDMFHRSESMGVEYDVLFDRAYDFCQKAHIVFDMQETILNDDGQKVPGVCKGNRVSLSTEYFNSKYISNKQKSMVILHEMIHAATTYAMNAYARIKKDGEAVNMSKDIYDSCARIERVFRSIKYDPRFKKQYGNKKLNEMIAELSNPAFVSLLKTTYTSKWNEVLDLICRILGIDKSFSNYAKLKEAVDYIITHPDYRLASDYYQKAALNSKRFYLDESQFYDASDVRYQQRTNTLTDREVLSMASDRLNNSNRLSDGERDALRIFNERLEKLHTLSEQRAEQGRLYKEQQFGEKVDRKAAAETLNRMHVLDGQIKDANEAVLSVENKEVLRKVLVKAREVVEEEERAHGKEILERWRDRTRNAAAIKKYRERIQADVTDLSNRILKPDGKSISKHVPDALKNVVIPFLTSIDFTSKRQLKGGEATKADAQFVKRMENLHDSLVNGELRELYAEYDLPPYFEQRLSEIIKDVKAITESVSGDLVINRMTAEELQQLSSVVRTLKKAILNANRFHANAMFQHVDEAGYSTVSELSAMKSNDGKANAASNFVFWQQIRPAYAFERFGEGGKAIYDGLRRGQAKLAFNTKKIIAFSKEAYTSKEVKDWDKQIIEVKIADGTMVRIKATQAMSLYKLYQQKDSREHILGGGIRVSTYTVKGEKISDSGHVVTQPDVESIINALTPRQREVADNLQRFMADQGAAWGNHVSVARFGEEMFTNKDYFPINSDGQLLTATADKAAENSSLYALLNMSFTKSRQEGANNRIVLYGIFDVFSNHMASMAQYNAMALPVLDAVKWFNYEQKDPDTRKAINGVRAQMIRVYGMPEEKGKNRMGYAEAFVMNILKAFNGTEAQGAQTDNIGLNTLRRYNLAQIAYNFRVVVQQPLAILRAAMVIDYGSIIRGLRLSPAAISKNIEEMQEHSGIAAWKSLGFYDVNISRGLTDIIKNEETTADKIREVGMIGAEKMDTLTWAAIWSACKEQVSRKRGINPGDNGYYEAVSKLFDDVIYKTQVVDSILTKNEFMRSKGFWARAIGSFMSEPATTASMVVNAYDKYNLDLKRGMDAKQAWKNNKALIGRTMYVYALSQTILAAVTAVIDGLRDDDEYEDFIEKWLEAFKGNIVDELLPFNKLPYISQVYEAFKEILSAGGWDTYGQLSNFTYLEILEKIISATSILHDKITGEYTNYTEYAIVYKLLQAASGVWGMPMATATREIVTAWNNTVGAMAPSMKIKTYDPGDLGNIKFAYLDGYLTAEEATALILEKGLRDTEDEAYFLISEWDSGEGYSRYDKVYDAVLYGGDYEAAVSELVSHGYTEEEITAQIKSQIGRWYYDETSDVRISKDRATELLEEYTDMSRDEIKKTINRWSSKVVTGTAYNDIADEYMEGKITASRAIEMYTRYGSMTREEAKEKVDVLTFVKKHPECDGISFSAVEGYTKYCEPTGMSAGAFYKVWKHASTVQADTGKDGKPVPGSKKKKMLKYIDSLALSNRQKDALYRAFGWSDDGLSDAPWH